MTKTKSTKRALLLSALSLLMCVSMLIGSTFAWFTDSVTSAGNKIVAGTLDIQLLMDADVNGTYDDISESTSPIFGEGSIAQNNNAETLWEPGKTQVAYLAIKNIGNLDLKYTVGLNVQNVSKDLYEVMEYAIVPDADANNKVTAWNGGNSVVVGTQSVAGDVTLAKGATHYFALVIHMDEDAGNKYQGGEVNFDLTVLATQVASESDSFGNQYDANAKYPVVSTVTVPENNTEDVVISTGTFEVAVPATSAQAGDVCKVEVTNEKTETDSATGETTVSFDLTLYKNNVKVSSGNTVYAVTQNIGADKIISKVTHNGTALEKADTGADQTYTYDSATGDLTIYTASFSTFEVAYKEYADNFADNSWNAIIRACQKNSVPATWNVGDKKAMTIGGSTYDVVIIGKNHDAYSDGSGKAPLTFQLADVYGTTAAMNATQTNATGWSGSQMRNTTMVEILSAMPSEVQNAIKAVNKETLKGDGSGLETTSDKLFLLSLYECYGSTFYSNGYEEGSKYDYYSDKTNRVMSGTWWLRGPGINNGKNNGIGFTQINMSGLMANGSAEYASGVVFGFCF